MTAVDTLPGGFAWRKNQAAPVDAIVFGETVERIRLRDGIVTAEAIVDEARDPASPLHDAFVWDNDHAAELYRRTQARKYVRALVVVEDDGEHTAYVNVPVVEDDGSRSRGYQTMRVVVSNDEQYAAAVASVTKLLRTLRARHAELVALKDVWDAVDGLDD